MSIDKIKEIEKQIKSNSKTIDKLYMDNADLEAERQRVGVQVVKSAGLFDSLIWELELSYDKRLYLKGSYFGSKKPEVFEILRDKYHCNHYEVYFEPEITGHFNDNEISFTFKNVNFQDNLNHAILFIKNWNIKIDTEEIIKKLDQRRTEVSQLQDTLSAININQYFSK